MEEVAEKMEASETVKSKERGRNITEKNLLNTDELLRLSILCWDSNPGTFVYKTGALTN